MVSDLLSGGETGWSAYWICWPYQIFKRVCRGKVPRDYKYIPLHFVFDVKPDWTRKVRLVAGGHVISTPDCPLYSSVVKTESVRIIMTITAKQGLQVITGDVGGAYLNAKCAEKSGHTQWTRMDCQTRTITMSLLSYKISTDLKVEQARGGFTLRLRSVAWALSTRKRITMSGSSHDIMITIVVTDTTSSLYMLTIS